MANGTDGRSIEESVKVVFVSSLPHSGSTLLDLTLSAHPKLVGFGELAVFFSFYQREREVLDSKICTCGAGYRDCPVWVSVRTAFEAEPPTDDAHAYRLFLRTFREQFGSDAVMVDSSKRRKHLRALTDAGADVRVLALTRDVRSWTVSQRRLQPTLSLAAMISESGPAAVPKRIKLTAPWLGVRWYRLNRALDRTRQELGCDALRIGYEEFATAPNRVLGSIWRFLDVDAHDDVLQREPATHILFGNQMRRDRSLRSGIFYDTRWMADRSWHLAAFVLRRVMAYNSQQVYSGGQLLPFGPDKHLHALNQQPDDSASHPGGHR